MLLVRTLSLAVVVYFCFLGSVRVAGDDIKPEPSPVMKIASKLLDENLTADERVKLIRSKPELAADLLQSLVEDIKPGTDQERARIPWLWEISTFAAEHNNGDIIVRILDVAIPKTPMDVEDWQIAVIGGGLIFEMSKRNFDPRRSIEKLVARDPLLQKRWRSLVAQSKKLMLDENQSIAIRYDALRIFAMSDWQQAEKVYQQLFTSAEVSKKSEKEIRLAALSAISDFDKLETTDFLVNHFAMFSYAEREKACRAIAGKEKPALRFLRSVQQGIIIADRLPRRSLTLFRSNASTRVRNLAAKIFFE